MVIACDVRVTRQLHMHNRHLRPVAAVHLLRTMCTRFMLFYLLFAAACWAVYVRDREGVRWMH